jgi:hypothetical protein
MPHHRGTSRGRKARLERAGVLGLMVVTLLVATSDHVSAQDNAILQWNDVTLRAIRSTGFAPPRAARGFAIIHTCVFDAWAAYDTTAVGSRLGGSLRRPRTEHSLEHKQQAVSVAAYRALVDLFPTQTALFDDLMTTLGYDPADASMDVTTPTGVGNTACAAVLDFRHGDGANQLGGYADSTDYTPMNAPTPAMPAYVDRWQPIGTQRFLAPHWGHVTPFALTDASQFRPKAPVAYGTRAFDQQAEEILHLNAKLTERTKAIALYWADGPSTETPPGHWNLFAQWVSRRDGHTLDQDVKMFFALGNALLDASVSVWEAKYFYDYARPLTAIRVLKAGTVIDAWAGPGLGTQPIAGDTFRSYIATPPFAEYTIQRGGRGGAHPRHRQSPIRCIGDVAPRRLLRAGTRAREARDLIVAHVRGRRQRSRHVSTLRRHPLQGRGSGVPQDGTPDRRAGVRESTDVHRRHGATAVTVHHDSPAR